MRKIFSSFIVFLLLFSQLPIVASAQAFEDVPSDFWAYQEIEWAASKGYVKGYNGTFKHSGTLTEAQFVSMLVNFFGQKGHIKPAQAEEHWAQPLYNHLKTYNLPLKGYTSNTTKNAFVTRGTVAKVLAAATGGKIVSQEDAVAFMYQYGISTGRNGIKTLASYGPDELFTRAQACVILYRLSKNPDLLVLKEANEKTIDDIVQKFLNTKATFKGDPFAQVPSIKAPYATGALQAGFVKDGENSLNFIRYLAGLEPVTATADLNKLAQHGAVLMASTNYVEHWVQQPSDMPDDFYKTGSYSLSTANLQGAYLKSPSLRYVTRNDHHSLAYAVKRWIEDAEEENYQSVGHRRWALYPQLKTVGFGYATNKVDNGVSSMQVTHSTENGGGFGKEFVAYPNKGYFPTEYASLRQPWSISLDPDMYQSPSETDITISVTRKSDGQTWTLTHTDNDFYNSGEYLAVDPYQSYGQGYNISFHPGVHYRAYDGDYEVVVKGLKDINGKAKPLSYKVKFFSLMDELAGKETKDRIQANSFAKKGTSVFYIESNKIYELNTTTGKKQEIVLKDGLNQMALVDNYLFYRYYIDGSYEIHKYDLSTKKVEKLPYFSFTAREDFAVTDRFVYIGDTKLLLDGSLYKEYALPKNYYYNSYTDDKGDQIYFLGESGDPVQLTSERDNGKSTISKVGDWIYFIKGHGGGAKSDIIRLHENTKQQEDLTSGLEDAVFSYKIVGDHIYLIAEYRLYRMNLDGTNMEELGFYGIDDFAVYDNSIYILIGNTYYDYTLERYVRETKAYKTDINGGNMIKL
ncbi:DUF5050 domain-containing protein [Bacillus sp. HMF5848]|uniref:CAP domain-containing protein n=1 Tax=Bacillus sp. HMF5848 TaxID=2495421 RepID=UPI000F7887D5|nr:S-layer homology domain-containing protein [Bacillus sp. HMF5848]RSK28823.1 DUF5050 domain-containing protein [Bacillus sp. HMF5848]